MQILHIIYDDIMNPWCGGGGALRACKFNEYIARKHTVTVITGNYPGAQNETISGVNYIRIGSSKSYLLSRISFTLILPFIINKYSSDIVINDCSYFAPCFAEIYTKRPCVSIVHYLMGSHCFTNYPILGVFPFLFEKILIFKSNNIITPSNYIKHKLKYKYPLKSVKNIPNGISSEYFQCSFEEKDFMLYLGRIDFYIKGIDILVKAFKYLIDNDLIVKNTNLVIAGDGKCRDVRMLKKLIIENNLQDRILLPGRINGNRKLELLRTCKFLLLPSRIEGWGISAVEANASGKPVIGSNIDGLKEAVINNKTAVLVESENVRLLSEAIEKLLYDDKLRESLGREGRKWAGNFEWDLLAEQQLNFYTTIILP